MTEDSSLVEATVRLSRPGLSVPMPHFVIAELTQEAPKLEGQTPITLSMHGLVEEPRSSLAEEEGGTPMPTSGLLQVAERRRKYRASPGGAGAS